MTETQKRSDYVTLSPKSVLIERHAYFFYTLLSNCLSGVISIGSKRASMSNHAFIFIFMCARVKS